MKNLKTHAPVLSRFFSTLGFQAFAFYAFYTAFQQSDSAFCVGMIGLLLYLPTLALGLFWGAKSDKIVRVGKTYFVIQFLPVAAFALIPSEEIHLNLLFALVFFTSVIRSLRTPVYYSVLGSIKSSKEHNESKHLVRHNTLAWQIPLFISPMLIGLHTNHILEISHLLMIIQSIAVVFSIPMIKLRNTFRREAKKSNLIDDLKELKDSKQVLVPLFIDAAIALMLGISVFLPFLLENQNLNGEKFGTLKSLFHLGAVLMTIFLSSKFIQKLRMKHYSYLLILWSAMLIASSSLGTFVLISIWVLGMGVIDGVSTLYRENLLLNHASAEKMGKLSSINALLISTGDELGEFNTGILIEKIGILGFIAISSAVSLLGAFVIKVKSREFFCKNAEIKQGG